MNDMLDTPESLMKLSRDDLDDILLQQKYNKQNLRELLRKTLATANTWKKAYEYQKELEEKRPVDSVIAAIESMTDTLEIDKRILLGKLKDKLDDLY